VPPHPGDWTRSVPGTTNGDTRGGAVSVSRHGRLAVSRPRVTTADLASMRHLVRHVGHRVGLPSDRVARLVLAVNEAVSNAIQHGGGSAHVVISYRPTTNDLVVWISDVGAGIPRETPMGRPQPESLRGRGLYLVQLLCDEAQIVTSTAGATGTSIKLVMHVDER
jgi:serine/threonine-protein kinase RsbW